MIVRRGSAFRRAGGFSYAEVLAATVLLGVAIVPALESLDSGIRSATVQNTDTARLLHLREVFEATLDQPFNDLSTAAAGTTTASSYSEAAGTTHRVLVYLAAYDLDDADGDNDRFTGGEDSVLWLNAVVEDSGHALSTLRHR